MACNYHWPCHEPGEIRTTIPIPAMSISSEYEINAFIFKYYRMVRAQEGFDNAGRSNCDKPAASLDEIHSEYCVAWKNDRLDQPIEKMRLSKR